MTSRVLRDFAGNVDRATVVDALESCLVDGVPPCVTYPVRAGFTAWHPETTGMSIVPPAMACYTLADDGEISVIVRKG